MNTRRPISDLGAGAAISLAFLLLAPTLTHGGLNVELQAPDDLVTKLRKSIFIETSNLRERENEQCSSLDGPNCLVTMFGAGAMPSTLDGADMGVVPERLLQGLGVDALEFVTPEYSVIELFRRQAELREGRQSIALGSASVAAPSSFERPAAEHGVLHFGGLSSDRRVPLAFSRGLPGNVVATWDGRWIVKEGQEYPEEAELLPSPYFLAPVDSDKKEEAPAIMATGLSGAVAGTIGEPSAAQLAGSVGYVRFSRPVVVRSILARWNSAASSASPAVVGGRLGLRTAWTSHLDPARLQSARGWYDICGDPLRQVDEIAFLAATGLEVGAMEISVHGGGDGDEERVVLLLQPLPLANGHPITKGETHAGPGPQVELRAERLSAASAPYVMSLQEALDQNLVLASAPEDLGTDVRAPSRSVPGLLTTRSHVATFDLSSIRWVALAGWQRETFEHRAIGTAVSMLAVGLATSLRGEAAASTPGGLLASAAETLVKELVESPTTRLPKDLHRLLQRERADITEALQSWVIDGDMRDNMQESVWRSGTLATLEQSGSDASFSRYDKAKRSQTKLDILAAAFLHLRR